MHQKAFSGRAPPGPAGCWSTLHTGPDRVRHWASSPSQVAVYSFARWRHASDGAAHERHLPFFLPRCTGQTDAGKVCFIPRGRVVNKLNWRYETPLPFFRSSAVQSRLLYIRSPDGATRRINLGFYYPIYAAIVIINVALILLSYIKQIYTILWSLSDFFLWPCFMSL